MPSTVLIITGERNWTLRAVHLAAAMARDAGLAVVMARLVPVAHLEYLGSSAREALLSYDEFDALREYIATAEAYGVPFSIEWFEYSDYIGGVTSAAEQHGAAAVFAPAPGGIVGLLARWRLAWLRRTLGRPLYTLEPGDALPAWTEPAEPPAAPATNPSMSARQL